MAPSSGEETCPVSATPDCACRAGGGENASPTVKIAVVASHLPCMRISVSPWECFRLGLDSRLFESRLSKLRYLWHSDAGYPVCRGCAGLFWCCYDVDRRGGPRGRPVGILTAGA